MVAVLHEQEAGARTTCANRCMCDLEIDRTLRLGW